jgi:hypothetical protein
MAHDILPIPVTTVASESAFGTSGRVLSAHRGSLAPNMAEALMCMQAWSRADMLGTDILLYCILLSSSTFVSYYCPHVYHFLNFYQGIAILLCMLISNLFLLMKKNQW